MVKEINEKLEKIGSKFRTEDGKTLAMYIGHLTFLKREFDTEEECEQFVNGVYEKVMKGVEIITVDAVDAKIS